MRVGRGAAPGELVQVRLADHDRALALQARRHRRVLVRDPVGEDLAAGRGRLAGDCDVVLDGDRHAVQRAEAVAGGDHRVRGRGDLPRGLAVDRDEGPQTVVERADAREARVDELHRRDLAPRDRGGGIDQRQLEQLAALLRGTHCSPPGRLGMHEDGDRRDHPVLGRAHLAAQLVRGGQPRLELLADQRLAIGQQREIRRRGERACGGLRQRGLLPLRAGAARRGGSCPSRSWAVARRTRTRAGTRTRPGACAPTAGSRPSVAGTARVRRRAG